MSDRSPNLDTLKLTLAIMARLSDVIPMSVAMVHSELKDQFPKTLRTYQRLLKFLAEEGYAACDSSDKTLTYYRGQRAKPLVSSLTLDEALLLQLARRQLATLLPPKSAQQLQTTFDRAWHALLPSAKTGLVRQERAWLNKVGVAPTNLPLLAPEIDPGIRIVVAEALFRDQLLDVDYQSPKTGRKQHLRLVPLALMQQGPRLYLMASYERESAVKQFALHRIKRAENTRQPVPKPGVAFDLALYIESGQAGWGEGEQVQVVFDLEPESAHHLSETPLSPDQSIEVTEEGWWRVRATVPDCMWTWDWLRSFGERLELLEPADRVEWMASTGLARP